MREEAMKKKGFSELTRWIIHANEAAIRVRRQSVAKTMREIEDMRKQNRELMGRESHEEAGAKAYEHQAF